MDEENLRFLKITHQDEKGTKVIRIQGRDEYCRVRLNGTVEHLGGIDSKPPESVQENIYFVLHTLGGECVGWCHTRRRADALATDFAKLGVAVVVDEIVPPLEG